jgi:autotransporter-associated beta strand protein
MINARNVSAVAAVTTDSQPSRRRRALGLSVAAAMLAGTALVPATAQTFDIGGGPLVVTDFVGPPLNNPTAITNGQLTVDAGVDLTFGGALNNSFGVFSLTKAGAASLTLSGTNTYTGGTTLQSGTLVTGINGAFGTGAISVVGNAVLTSSGAGRTVANAIGINAGRILTVSSDAGQTMIVSGVISGDGVLRKAGTGTTVRLTGANTYTGGTALDGGTLVAGNNSALGTGDVVVVSAATLSSFGANRLLANNVTINAGAVLSLTSATNQVLTLSGVISGDGALRKGGSSATVQLTGVNTYTGGTTLAGGRIEIGNASAFSTGAVTTSGPNASTIALVDPNTSLTLANALNLTGASLSVEAPAGGQTLTLAGPITGLATRALTISGAGTGTVLLTGNNSIAANVNVNTGSLGVGNNSALNGAGALVMNGGTTLAFHGADLAVARRINNTNFVNVQATVDTRGFNATLSGIVQDNVNGTLGLTKVGAGILTLSNPAVDLANRNILTGGAQVNEGTLNIVTGALRGTVTVNNGGTLAGTGSVAIGATTINSGGTLSPGNALVTDSVGTLTFADLTTNAGSTINFNLAAPGASDLVVVNGNLSLAGTLNLAGLPGFGLGTYTLFTHTGALTNNLTLGTLPQAGFTYNLLAGVGQLNLSVSLADFYWDGAGVDNDIIDGCSGTWAFGTTNRTDEPGTIQAAYIDDVTSRAFFQGAPGTVTLAETFIFSELHFLTDGYVINPVSAQGLASLAALVNVADGVTATINAAVDGPGGLTKNGNGTLNLGATNTYEGGTFLNAGRLNIRENGGLGIDGVTMAGGPRSAPMVARSPWATPSPSLAA